MNQEQAPNQIVLTSPDGKEARLAELRRLFPDLFDGEGALDEKALRLLVSDEAGHITERFRFEWAGCVFRGDAPTDSDLMRPRVPILSAHRFRGIRPPL
jgi:hypothetical protein